MITEIVLPQLNANEESATLVKCYLDDLGVVSKNQVVCSVETTKSILDVESGVDGYIKYANTVSDTIKTGQVLAWVSDSLDELTNLKVLVSKPSIQATKKATALAVELGIDLAKVRAIGPIIREQDILLHAQKSNRQFGKKEFVFDAKRGVVIKSFLAEITNNLEFKLLPSEEKVMRYRQAGAEIASGAKIKDGAVILAENIVIGQDAIIGCDSQIKCQSFKLGRMSVIGDRANILTRHVDIGDVFYSGPNILIGGGGAFGANAHFSTGHSCLVSGWCLINSGNGVILGNEVALSPYVKLYTHNHWQNILEGYHSNFGPIYIDDGAYITGDSIVVPNLKIGAGATILANSTVICDVPNGAVFAGVPAKEVGRVNPPKSIEDKERILSRVLDELYVELDLMAANSNTVKYCRTIQVSAVSSTEIILCFEIIGDLTELPDGAVIFDLSNYQIYGNQTRLTDEIRNFMRKRGIRFSPIYWRYTHDENLYNG
jgi:acetyltransferase-like isoleucine patch superfamily enzyme